MPQIQLLQRVQLCDVLRELRDAVVRRDERGELLYLPPRGPSTVRCIEADRLHGRANILGRVRVLRVEHRARDLRQATIAQVQHTR